MRLPFDPSGPVADDIASLWSLLFVVGLIVYAGVLALLVVPIVRRRRAGALGVDDRERRDVPPRLASRWIVGGGVLLPTVVMAAALGASVVTMRRIPQAVPPGGLRIEVVGHQWWWSIRYPTEDVTAANEIHIPVGRPVELKLTSSDVIHSFWVPDLGGKIDALPDRTNTLVIEADEPGVYRGRCAEFCGLQHAKMMMLVIAEPAARFDMWLEGQRADAAAPDTDSAARGQEVFARRGCATCHAIRGTTAKGRGGPDLTHFASRRTLAAATLPNTPEHVRRWLHDPDSVKEGSGMAAIALTDAELEALLAYLTSLG